MKITKSNNILHTKITTKLTSYYSRLHNNYLARNVTPEDEVSEVEISFIQDVEALVCAISLDILSDQETPPKSHS